MLSIRKQLLCAVPAWLLGSFLFLVWQELVAERLIQGVVSTFSLSSIWSYYAIQYIFLSILLLPPLLVAMLVQRAFETHARRKQGDTLCGRCGFILKGLREPRCPECGNRI